MSEKQTHPLTGHVRIKLTGWSSYTLNFIQ